MHYNFVRIHKTLNVTPAMAASASSVSDARSSWSRCASDRARSSRRSRAHCDIRPSAADRVLERRRLAASRQDQDEETRRALSTLGNLLSPGRRRRSRGPRAPQATRDHSALHAHAAGSSVGGGTWAQPLNRLSPIGLRSRTKFAAKRGRAGPGGKNGKCGNTQETEGEVVGAKGFEPSTPRSRTEERRPTLRMILGILSLGYRQGSDPRAVNLLPPPDTTGIKACPACLLFPPMLPSSHDTEGSSQSGSSCRR